MPKLVLERIEQGSVRVVMPDGTEIAQFTEHPEGKLPQGAEQNAMLFVSAWLQWASRQPIVDISDTDAGWSLTWHPSHPEFQAGRAARDRGEDNEAPFRSAWDCGWWDRHLQLSKERLSVKCSSPMT